MIEFYPSEIGMWVGKYSRSIELSMAEKRYEVFRNRFELVEFLKSSGVVLTDAGDPLLVERVDMGEEVYVVCQKGVVYGWFKDNYR